VIEVFRALRNVNTCESYHSAAEAYAQHLFGELYGKPLDRHLLDRFAAEVRGRGRVADVGCGPGHVARYLAERGVDVFGVDLSPAMVDSARRRNPGLEFREGDLRALDLRDGSLAGVLGFYAIVHFELSELDAVFAELRRVLSPGGALLVAFHAGEETVHVEDLFGRPVSLDFRFHKPAAVSQALRSASFAVVESLEREPYPGAEYPSHRCYLLARAV